MSSLYEARGCYYYGASLRLSPPLLCCVYALARVVYLEVHTFNISLRKNGYVSLRFVVRCPHRNTKWCRRCRRRHASPIQIGIGAAPVLLLQPHHKTNTPSRRRKSSPSSFRIREDFAPARSPTSQPKANPAWPGWPRSAPYQGRLQRPAGALRKKTQDRHGRGETTQHSKWFAPPPRPPPHARLLQSVSKENLVGHCTTVGPPMYK